MMNDNFKKGLVRSISDQFNRTIKLTAFTVAVVTPIIPFGQSYGCDSDPDVCVTGYPPPDLPDPYGDYDGPTPGCDYLGDSDCDDSGGSSGGDGGSGSGNPSPAQCLALEQSKPDNCHSNPFSSIGSANYNSWLSNRFGNINPLKLEYNNQGYQVWRREFRFLTYPVAITVGNLMSNSYLQSGSYLPSRGQIWAQLGTHCQHGASDQLEFCLQEQADFMASLHPDASQGGGSWSGSLSWGGFSFSIGGSSPSGNWVSQFLNKVQEDKVCHLWYQHPHQDGCN
ncbi:hypothetical protein OS175_15150 [Marinicella sp. S1101]|uniref:hypothetical protein n=1 Tax=Marinicella marina TaxID=2996016 RepID=UPI002260E91E|nr:hypothetical protein [Marinicella marina]MCX7555207.1 hypothetical protein [Marinicella marina]MDJ1141611.1 hypothetical protein [Marinicella marina]